MTQSIPRSRTGSARPLSAASSASGSAISGVMSLKTPPAVGKSAMSRMRAARSTVIARLAGSAGDLAQVADEQQVLEVRRDGREVLQRLERLLAPVGVARAQRRGEDLLEQRGLAVGRGAEGAQVATADAVAGELGDGADDLALGLVEVLHAATRVALDHAEVLELGDELRLGARLLEHVLERVHGAGLLDGDARAPAPLAARLLDGRPGRGRCLPLRGAAGGQLLADDAQRQELVALQAQDRPQPLDVGLRVEPVPARRPAGREELLVLEVADLGDRDVRELLPERLAHGADGHRLLAGCLLDVGVLDGHQRARNVSLYLPICSSSPSSRRLESMRDRLT